MSFYGNNAEYVALNEATYDEAVLNEGANLDATKELISIKKKFKEESKAIKKLIKEKKYTEAKNRCKELRAIVNESIDTIEKIEFSESENMIGFLLDVLYTFVSSFIVSFIFTGWLDLRGYI